MQNLPGVGWEGEENFTWVKRGGTTYKFLLDIYVNMSEVFCKWRMLRILHFKFTTNFEERIA
ncbi:hypothetical protein GCM10007063_34550 [Lentibacillus kapialis]|uniref:Uncharacterized protein n=1 Tax=Lentibacillus kapialis TaxID=340214 RepID=A0A917Q2P8_9BACI|nr:hypothetical protein GCM10007063_34550 [Lentibacillus kapialis]